MTNANFEKLVDSLSSFDAQERMNALEEISSRLVSGKPDLKPPRAISNMHLHTFYSFNALSFSPARIVYEAKRRRLEVVGTVDFDVLDAVEETLHAGDLLGVKSAAGMETRVFVSDYRDRIINSPNEPGIYYLVGAGFVSDPRDAEGARVLARLRGIARSRTAGLAERVNDFLGEVRVRFERDVLPLTPAGNATERHLLSAYDRISRRRFPVRAERLRFWAGKLREPEDRLDGILDSPAEFHELVRARLMKFGSVGYAPPRPENFPSLDDVVAMIRSAGAIPSATFLDGTIEGERNIASLMEFMRSRGVEACTLVPERNWRIDDPEEKKHKLAKLAECVEVARDLGMPLLAGTEMNKPGQPFVDEFERPELAPYAGDFIAGARLVHGHTMLARARNAGYLSEWSRNAFGDDRPARNDFYARLGGVAEPGEATLRALADVSDDSPEGLLAACRRSGR